ncbi:MAG: hypothetical protein ACRCY3_04540 [Sphingorhabdus sp.]
MIRRLKSPGFLIWLGLALLLTWLSREAVLTRSGWDPDDQLRLVQLRDFLNGQSWFDTTQYRMNPPEGAPMHWSRLIELPLAAIVILLRPLFGQPVAEMVAGTLVPLGCFGLVVFMLSRVAGELGGRGAAIAAIIVAMVSPAISMQLRPMRIDHHGWQLVCASLALWTLFWPSARKSGMAFGLALAVWLHISLEGAPSAAIFFALLGWRWAMNGDDGERLATAVLAFAGSSLFLFFATQPSGWGAENYCDTIAPVHIWAIGAAAAIMGPAASLLPANRLFRIGIALAAAACAIGVIAIFAPACTKGAFASMDPVVHEYWYMRISEGMPVWHQDGDVAAMLLGVPLAALATMGFLYRGLPQTKRAELAVLLLYGLILASLVFRTVSVATLVAVPVLASGIAALFTRYRAETKPVLRIACIALMIVLLMPGAFIAQIFLTFSPAAQTAQDPIGGAQAAEGCEALGSVERLNRLLAARLVAPFDIGPAILLTTPHQVLASSHHRNEKAMRDHIDIYRLPPAQARLIVERRGLTHIVGCKDEAEMIGYQSRDPEGLWAQLAKGNRPLWLEPVPNERGSLMLWRVISTEPR